MASRGGIWPFSSIFLYVLLSWLFRQVEKDPFQSLGLLGNYQARLTKKGYAFLFPLIILANMEGLLLRLGLAQKVVTLWFPDLSRGTFLAILLGFVLCLPGLGVCLRFSGRATVSFWSAAWPFCSSRFIPIWEMECIPCFIPINPF